MSTKDLYQTLQTSCSASTSPWQIGHDLLQRKEEVDTTGESQGLTTLDQIIKSMGLSRSTGRLWLRIVTNLDESTYSHLPLSKLRHLLVLPNETIRKEFLDEHNVSSMSVRELKNVIQNWNDKDSSPTSSEATTPRSPNPSNHLPQLLILNKKYLALGHEINTLIETILTDTNRREVISIDDPSTASSQPHTSERNNAQ